MNRMAATRVSVVKIGGRSDAANAGGGGSTPASGSVTGLLRAIDGDATSTMNAIRNGSATSIVERMLVLGMYLFVSCCVTPSAIPPANAIGRLVNEPMTAAAIAEMTSTSKNTYFTWPAKIGVTR